MCKTSCDAGSTCTVDCTPLSDNCQQPICAVGAHCILKCDNNKAKSCNFGMTGCPMGAVKTVCPDGKHVTCNADCPQ